VPLPAFGLVHCPVAWSQVPGTWHWSSAEHTTGLAPVHVPFWHVSTCVQVLPSLQPVPLPAFGLVHCPVAWLQVPATWHWSRAEHMTGLAPLHAPFWQASVCVHEFPSSQTVPLPMLGLEHSPVAGLQVPAT